MTDQGAAYGLARDDLIALLSLVQLEVGQLRTLTESLKDAQAVPPAAELRNIEAAFERLKGHRDGLGSPLAASPPLNALAAATVETLRQRVDAALREAEALSATKPPADAAAVRAAVLLVRTQLDLVYDASLEMTVPYRVKQLLHSRRVGRSLEFAAVFTPPLPSAERRTAMLAEFELSAGYLDEGVVDVARGVIWRRSGNAAIRILSCFSPLLFAAIAAGLLLLISSVADTDRLSDENQLINSYLIVLLGTAAHLLVENVKLSQAADAPILAIGAFVDWLHLRWAGIGATFFAILVAVLGLRLTLPEDALKPGWETTLLFFFAGYSVDSVAGIFLTRFGTAAPAGVAAVNAQIQPPGGGATS